MCLNGKNAGFRNKPSSEMETIGGSVYSRVLPGVTTKLPFSLKQIHLIPV